MGTHPICESDFDCLTEMITDIDLSEGWEGPIWISRHDKNRTPNFEYIPSNVSESSSTLSHLLSTQNGCRCERDCKVHVEINIINDSNIISTLTSKH